MYSGTLLKQRMNFRKFDIQYQPLMILIIKSMLPVGGDVGGARARHDALVLGGPPSLHDMRARD